MLISVVDIVHLYGILSNLQLPATGIILTNPWMLVI